MFRRLKAVFAAPHNEPDIELEHLRELLEVLAEPGPSPNPFRTATPEEMDAWWEAQMAQGLASVEAQWAAKEKN